MPVDVHAGQPTAAQFYRNSRPSGLLTEQFNHRVAAWLSLSAHRLRWTPTTLTACNLVLGVATSVGVLLLAGPMAVGDVSAWLVGLTAWTLWQLAYIADCADGQLARVTSTASPAGGRLDILCDIAVQIALVAAIAAVTTAARPGTPAWLVAVFSGSWMVNLVTSVMSKEGTNVSLVASEVVAVRLVKLVRDYSFMITLIAAVIAVRPAWMIWVMVLFTAINSGFLLASIAQAGRANLTATAKGTAPR
ncbi:CDP-alcohol phosphatidyltransferase family protein [Planosporangium flavigriseum]|uniref:CDP-alcohol phosphatidyltransferase n=1 Tax=Planosporangium flavigriseum TaxID=373681 RepID=A0A8J3LXW9_9ACTN|nr:CDP-alcohol phosphatidyltransferase family protein [Planosporangium flavigriseum]NJC67490.1 CDP-alcohol phosphatidyltransferase family protein [Planosporangium flavigriseum]GIG75561.1 hypothetical protein Pfl04_39650 [Planosporangium flavigriseum]